MYYVGWLTTKATTFFEAFETSSVIKFALFRVGQNFVSKADVFELKFSNKFNPLKGY